MSGPPASQKCPGCPAVYKTATMQPGQRFRCVKCEAIVTVGAPAAPSAAPPAPKPAAPAPAKAVPQPAAPAAPATAPAAPPAGGGGGLFSIGAEDDEVDLLDESGDASDLASALVQSAIAQQARQSSAPPEPAAPAASPAQVAAAVAAAGHAPSPAASGGLEVPGFQVGEPIGEGGMATVYKGVQTSLGRAVAIKVLKQDVAKDPKGLARFQKEAAVLSALSHAGIVGIIDAGSTGGQPYLVMEYIAGTNLRYLLENVRVPLDKLLSYVEQVLRALDYAHQKGVVHRDVKPENVVIGKDQQVKLADFGVAGLTEAAFGAPEAAQAGLTRTSTSLGTVSYVAPEQLKDARNAGPPADVYSTGVMLYEILTGELPLGAFEAPSKLNPNVPATLDAVVTRALKRNPAERFGSAGEMADAIDLARKGGAQPAAPSQPAARPAAPSMPPASQAPRPSTSPPGRDGKLTAEAEAALRQHQARKQEEESWKVWQEGQQQAQENRAGAQERITTAADGDLKGAARAKIKAEQKKKDAEFRKKWEAKQAAEAKKETHPFVKNLPGILGTLVGLVLLIAILGLDRSLPALRAVPGLESACIQIRGLAGL